MSDELLAAVDGPGATGGRTAGRAMLGMAPRCKRSRVSVNPVCLWSMLKLSAVKWSLQRRLLEFIRSFQSVWLFTKSIHLFFLSSSIWKLNSVAVELKFLHPGKMQLRVEGDILNLAS